MTFVLGTQKDYVQVHLVCKKMKNYKPLCSLRGDFTDEQIRAILASMNAEGRQGWKPSIHIMGEGRISAPTPISCKITEAGIVEVLRSNVPWKSITFCRLRLNNVMLMNVDGTCLQNLKVLKLLQCDGYSCFGLKNLARTSVGTNALRSLQVLTIHPLNRGQSRTDRLSNEVFMLAQRFTSLKKLNLIRCGSITDDGLRSYYTFQRDTRLGHEEWDISENKARLGQKVKVTLVHCNGITHSCVQEVMEKYDGIAICERRTRVKSRVRVTSIVRV